MLDKTKRYLVVGLGLLGGKYALELTKAGFHVDGINNNTQHHSNEVAKKVTESILCAHALYFLYQVCFHSSSFVYEKLSC